MSQINRSIIAISRASAQYRSEKTAPWGLKSCHTSYLMKICNHPGISQDQLAQLLLINKSNVARQAALLEESGFITRKPSEQDKRVLELYPTQQALQLLPQIRQLLREWETLITQDLTEEEIEAATRILEKMHHRAAQWMGDR